MFSTALFPHQLFLASWSIEESCTYIDAAIESFYPVVTGLFFVGIIIKLFAFVMSDV
jgi:hypothetical protein